MALKTFNVKQEVYEEFSSFCKSHGISMSKQIELFMESTIEKDPNVRKEFLEKMEKIRKGHFTPVENFAKRYGIE